MEKALPRIFCGLISALLFLYISPVFAQQPAVFVLTKANTYKLNEKIDLALTNSLSDSIFSVAASDKPEFAIVNFEQKAPIGWDALPLRCRLPSCKVDYVIPPAAQIKSGGCVNFSWQPKIFVKGRYVIPAPGTYRLTILYQVKKSKDSEVRNWTTVRSNIFTLEK